ncbi:hypothetical protein R1flu_005171 [Riccia fluitans]|uniref:Uncharacterized protein n=1 Tax=Riccia fluitans TaxID=41844 RepID=A0ABD1YSD8_9MARC
MGLQKRSADAGAILIEVSQYRRTKERTGKITEVGPAARNTAGAPSLKHVPFCYCFERKSTAGTSILTRAVR